MSRTFCSICGISVVRGVTGICRTNDKCRTAYYQARNNLDRKGPARYCSVCGIFRLYADNLTGICSSNDECRKLALESWRLNHRKYFGLTLADRKEMWEAQGKVCYLCWKTLLLTDIHIDHDHTHTLCGGQGCPECIRGLTHGKCNMLIGQLNDDPELIHLIADNLQRVNKQIRSSWEEYNDYR